MDELQTAEWTRNWVHHWLVPIDMSPVQTLGIPQRDGEHPGLPGKQQIVLPDLIRNE